MLLLNLRRPTLTLPLIQSAPRESYHGSLKDCAHWLREPSLRIFFPCQGHVFILISQHRPCAVRRITERHLGEDLYYRYVYKVGTSHTSGSIGRKNTTDDDCCWPTSVSCCITLLFVLITRRIVSRSHCRDDSRPVICCWATKCHYDHHDVLLL